MASNLAKNITFSLFFFLMASTIAHASRSRTYNYDPPTPPSYSYYYSYQDGPHYTNPSYTYQDKPYYTQPSPPTHQDEPPTFTQPPPQQPPPQQPPPQQPPPQQPPPQQPPPQQPPPTTNTGGGSPSDKEEFMQVHNEARAALGIPPLMWDEKVASFAQSWANQRINDCRMIHSNTDYGENIFWGSGKYSAKFATQSWVNERKYYDYNSNQCTNNMDCGHYTQIVWKKSTRLGCARVVCNSGGVFVTCNYDPPGNYIGQRPY